MEDWRACVENQGGARWSVSFAADGKELFYALVDVEAEQVLEAKANK